MLTPGDQAPDFDLLDQAEQHVALSGLRGRRVLVYFYPKADTPGCTKQACGFRDARVAYEKAGVAVLGISPDPVKKVTKFSDKFTLNFPLLADPDHAVADAYGVWGEKKNYGRTYMGIIRSSFLVGPNGKIQEAWYKVSPKATPTNLLQALAGSDG